MQKPAVSVIIPVYNTQQYLRESIDSIRRQTLREIEIIIIDDGSSDSSPQILRSLAGEDERIRIYTRKNRGQSVARNTGLGYACGEYIYFMDSDDLLDTDALEVCYTKCREQNLDFIFFNALPFCDEKNENYPLSLKYRHTNIPDKIYTGTEILQYLIGTNQYIVSPCLMLLKFDFINKYRLNFYPGIIHEDQLFTTLAYLQAGRVGYIGKDFFKRRFRLDSTMTRKYSWKNLEGYLTVTRQILLYGKNGTRQEKKLIGRYLSQMLNAAAYNAHVLTREEKRLFLKECFKINAFHYLSFKTIAKMFLKRS